MEDNIMTLKSLCKKTMEKLEECDDNLRAAGTMSVQDIDVLDKLTHMAKSLKTTIAMMEAEDGGESRRSYARDGRSMEGGNSNRMWYPGYAYADGDRMSRDGGSYDDGYGQSGRRGRDSMGRFTSRDGGGYSGHDEISTLMSELRELMPTMNEEERRTLKQMAERR